MLPLLQAMDSSLEQSIATAVIFAVSTVVAALQARHNDEMLLLGKMIKKFLFLNTASPSSTPLPNPKVFAKALMLAEMPTKALNKR